MTETIGKFKQLTF